MELVYYTLTGLLVVIRVNNTNVYTKFTPILHKVVKNKYREIEMIDWFISSRFFFIEQIKQRQDFVFAARIKVSRNRLFVI